MIKFKKYLSEAALSSSVANDDNGKLHELLLAKHLHPKKQLPLHHRSESKNPDHSGTPQQVHDKLKKKIGDAAYKEINNHAASTAKALHSHMEKHGHIPKGGHIADVHWTSNRDTDKKAGDHQKTTGKKDVNSNADLILTVHHNGKHHSYHGISAKYGTNKKPNYKNSGMTSLEKASGAPSGSFNKHIAAHNKHMEKLGYKGSMSERHAQHKKDRVGDKAGRERVKAAEHSSLQTRTKIAKEFATHLGKKTDKQLRDHIRDHVSPPTLHNHIVAHSHVKNDGSSTPIVHAAHSIADKHLDKYKDLHVKHSGISATIHGTHKETGKVATIARHVIKAASGPHKGVAGTFTL